MSNRNIGEPMSSNKEDLEHQVSCIKLIVNDTLEAVELAECQIQDLQARRAALRRDLVDLKDGRLDKIEERHGMDEFSKSTSVFMVEKKVEIGKKEDNRWYSPFVIFIKSNETKVTINNSMTKINAPGAYKMKNDETRFL